MDREVDIMLNEINDINTNIDDQQYDDINDGLNDFGDGVGSGEGLGRAGWGLKSGRMDSKGNQLTRKNTILNIGMRRLSLLDIIKQNGITKANNYGLLNKLYF